MNAARQKLEDAVAAHRIALCELAMAAGQVPLGDMPTPFVTALRRVEDTRQRVLEAERG